MVKKVVAGTAAGSVAPSGQAIAVEHIADTVARYIDLP